MRRNAILPEGHEDKLNHFGFHQFGQFTSGFEDNCKKMKNHPNCPKSYDPT